MFSAWSDEDTWSLTMTQEQLTRLLMCVYHIAMDHYSEGPQMCLSINKTLASVVESCFHGKNELSRQYISRWMFANCPRLLLPLHKYVVHCITTSYRIIDVDGPNLAAGIKNAIFKSISFTHCYDIAKLHNVKKNQTFNCFRYF